MYYLERSLTSSAVELIQNFLITGEAYPETESKKLTYYNYEKSYAFK